MTDSAEKYAMAMSLFHKLSASTKKSFVFSPLSLGTAFAILCATTKGDAQKELLQFLGHEDAESLHRAYRKLIAGKKLPFKIANRCLVKTGEPTEKTLVKFLETTYKAPMDSVDFVMDGRKIEAEINGWVSEKTDKMIQNLVSSGDFTADTIFVILNAVYFKGTWLEKFNELDFEQTFTQRTGEKVRRPFMETSSSRIEYTETGELKLAKIPYREAGCYLVVAIPKDENKFIDEVMAALSPDQMHEIITRLNSCHSPEVQLTIPKFKFEFTFENLIRTMVDLGVKKIFSNTESDFTPLLPESSTIRVSAVIHKAAIEVDEKGTTAAAATFVKYVLFSYNTVSTIRMTLDRPFYFAIHEGVSHTATFQGICHNL